MSSFSTWLQDNYGYDIQSSHQNIFSKYYTLWLNSVVLADESVQNWLEDHLDPEKWIAFEAGSYALSINQNDTEGAPYLDFGNGCTFDLGELFEGAKSSLTWSKGSATQTRYFYDSFVAPAAANLPPTDVHLVVDAAFAAAVAGVSVSADSAAANRFVEAPDDAPLVIGTLLVSDPDIGDVHTFALVPGSDSRFGLDGDQLVLLADERIETNDGSFSVTVEVTDSAGNTYYETFGFQVGTISPPPGPAAVADSLTGGNTGGSGTEAAPTTGDDLLFGFAQGDTLTGGSGDDALFGGKANDSLLGGAGNDQLFGGVGNDTISDGTGNDLIVGGGGADVINLTLDGETDILDYNALTEAGDTANGFSAAAPSIGGNGGDVVNLADLLDTGDFGGATLAQAIAGGYVALANAGGNAQISVDLDGSAGGAHAPVLIVTLNGIDLGAIPTALDDNIVVN